MYTNWLHACAHSCTCIKHTIANVAPLCRLNGIPRFYSWVANIVHLSCHPTHRDTQATVSKEEFLSFRSKCTHKNFNQSICLLPFYTLFLKFQLKKKTLEVTVWDYDRSSSNDFLGEVSASGIWIVQYQMSDAFSIYYHTLKLSVGLFDQLLLI